MKYVALFAMLLAGCGGKSGGEAGVKAIVGARVEPALDAEPIAKGTVVFAGGKVRAVGADVEVPEGAERIEGSGKVVRPMPYDGKIVEGGPADFLMFEEATGSPAGVIAGGEWVR